MAVITGTSVVDVLNGTADADTIYGLAGNDTIDGGDGDDFIYGGLGVDMLSGGNGEDTFVEDQPTSAGETFNGGAGFDTIELRTIPGPVVTSFGLLSPHGLSASTLSSIERLVFASQAGQAMQSSLLLSNWASIGLTQIVGGAGRDFLTMSTGTSSGVYEMPDLPLVGWDAVPANAWDGGDFVVLSSSAGPGVGVTLNARAGAGFLQLLSGGQGDDILNGSANADILDARAGADAVMAGAGNDLILIVNSFAPTGSSWMPPTTYNGAGATWNGGTGTDLVGIGGFVDLQATLVGIEGFFLQAAVLPPQPIVTKQDEGYLVLDQAHLAMLPAAAVFGGTGTVEIDLDDNSSFSGALFTFLPGTDVRFQIVAGTGNGVSIVGSGAADEIWFGTGTQTATGGIGADTFHLGQGTFTITDFTQGSDKFDVSGSGFILFDRLRDFLSQGANGAVIAGDSGGNHTEVRLNGVSAASLAATDFKLDTGYYSVYDNGTALADIMLGVNLDDQMHGGDGNDRIYSGGGADIISGDAGDDVIVLDGALNPNGVFGQPSITGGTGTDSLVLRGFVPGGFSQHSLYFANVLNGIETLKFDSKVGETLSAVLLLPQYQGAGITTVIGGAGIDQLVLVAVSGTSATVPTLNLVDWTNGPGGDAVVMAVAGSNTTGMTLNALQGAAFNQVLLGASGADTLNGSGADDVLRGNAGDDVLDGKAGVDQLVGGLGNDTYHVDAQADVIVESAGEGIDTAIATGNFYLYANVENLTLAAGTGSNFGVGNDLANVIAGNDSGNLLISGLGNDTIHGGAGDDSLFGEDGDDTLNGDAGIDYIVGGLGNDTINGGDNPDALYGEDGDDTIIGGASFDTDIFYGGAGNDIIYANSGLGDYDIMNGAAGNDTYYVDTPDDIVYEGQFEGTDTVYAGIVGAGFYLWAYVENCTLTGNTPFAAGNELNNVLTGSASDNWLLGNQGSDTLNGKAGNDVLFGDLLEGPYSSDTFVFDGVVGQDVIGDFRPGEDRIQLTGFYGSWAEVSTHLVQNGADCALDLGGGNIVVFQNLQASSFSATDFIFG
ncbi:Ca2+-binding RTX toxin-like protein [Novosphingobium kunmingense]|uniref:Ca2+-binding RTX toxin-like protein n=1 Tax=Novosphingobium kunmingense TaxID=1211806 RepID=A0A2N0HKH3_9SPHN|nr:calcium-binding protein [Novosphingobium kunmingense]PKB19447.1 Ca2+-binding RTX toxin-like protein [Novosphingobium kunmingense]